MPYDKNQFSTICVVAVIVFLIVYICYCAKLEQSFHEDFIFGSWESDSSFNDSAGIKQMKMFISEPKGFLTKTRDCYLHMDAHDGNLTSQVVKMKCTGGSYLPNMGKQKYKVQFEFEEEDDVIPSDLIMEIDPANGLLRLYDKDDNLYGALYKDNSSTHLVKVEKESGLDFPSATSAENNTDEEE